MLAFTLSKPICGLLAFLSSLGGTAGYIYFSKHKTSHTASNKAADNIEVAGIEEVVTPKAAGNNLAILVEVGGPNTNQPAPTGHQKVKCQLEGGTSADFCSLNKMTPLPERKWVDKTAFDRYAFNFFIPDGFITKEKVIYKVRVNNELITEWLASPNKKLNVYGQGDTSELTTPAITLSPTFAMTKEGKLKGKMQYVLGKTKVLHGSSSSQTNLDIEGKYFKCALPVSSGLSPEYKNCEFYVFDAEEKPNKSFYDDVLKSPLTKLKTVNNYVHYLLKFEEILDATNVKYGYYDKLKVKIFSDADRKTELTTGITEIHLQELSPFVFVGDDVNIQVAVVV